MTIAVADINAFSGHYQRVYDNDPQSTMFDSEILNPFYKNLDLESNGAGEAYCFTVETPGSTASSMDYELAGGAITSYQFQVKPVTIYFRATITREAIDKAKAKGSKALFNAGKMQLDAAIEIAKQKLQFHLARKNGEIATISGVSGTNFTLPKYALAMIDNGVPTTVVAAQYNGTGDLRGGASTPTEEIINSYVESTGVVTCASAVGFTNGDTVWLKGDVLGDQSERASLTGYFGWIDDTAATNGESFHAQDRYDANGKLEPVRMSLSGLDLRTAIVTLAAKARAKRIAVEEGYMASDQWNAMIMTADAREIVTVDQSKSAPGKTITLGSTALRVPNGNGGFMELFEWPDMPSGLLVMGKKGLCKLIYTDSLVRLHQEGGGLWQPVPVSECPEDSHGRKIPALKAEGSLRVNFVHKNPNKTVLGTSFTGA